MEVDFVINLLYRRNFSPIFSFFLSNGNILTLDRTNGQGETFDKLHYGYDISRNNQLKQVKDEMGASSVSNDLDNYERYEYDEIGNLIELQTPTETSHMTWTIYGKLATVIKENQATNILTTVTYLYDAMGHRVHKSVVKEDNSGSMSSSRGNYQTTYWRDAQGNVLKTETSGFSADLNGVRTSKNSEEFVIYGSSRLGTYSPVYNEYVNQFFGITANSLTLGFKAYELSNHLGNVLTTISDNYFAPQPSTGGVSARVLSSQDYFPFGMVMTERSFQEKQQRKYRFGFNGKEEDFDMGEGVLNFEARGMDSRTCRFTSVDPLAGKYPYNSPYVFCHNNPITYIDLNGLEPIKPKIKQNVIIIIFDADELKNYKNTPSDYNSFHVIMTTNIENASKQFLEYVGDNTVKNVCIVAHGSSGGGTSNLNQNQDYHVTSKKIRAYMSNPTNDPSISTPIVDDEAHILKDVQHLEEITTKIEDGGSLLMASCYGGLGEKGSEYGRDLAQLNCNRITIYLNQDKCNLSYQMPSKRDEKGNLVIDKEGKIDKYAHQIATLDVSISGKGYFKDGVVRVDTNGTQTKLKDLPNRTGRLIINTKDKTKPAFYEEEPSKKK